MEKRAHLKFFDLDSYTLSMEFEMLRSFNDNYDLLRYITNAINTIKIWLEILKTEIKSISLYSMPSVFMLTAFSLREEGGGRNIRQRTKI